LALSSPYMKANLLLKLHLRQNHVQILRV
jgi:hypothetical protein